MSHLVERAAAQLAKAGPMTPAGAGAGRGEQEQPLPSGLALATPPLIKISDLEKAGLLREGKIAAEQLWHVQRQLLRTAFDPLPDNARPVPANLVMVTSARPHEGKSFTAVNLATSIARQGDHSVLLVDTDPKEKAITGLFGVAEAAGLLDFAQRDDAGPEHAICKTEIAGLSFLPRGRARIDVPDHFAHRRMHRLITQLAFDDPDRLVLMDVAPCLACGDAAALAPVVGHALLVVEAFRTRKADVEGALDILQECAGISMLLNKSPRPGKTVQYGYPNYA